MSEQIFVIDGILRVVGLAFAKFSHFFPDKPSPLFLIYDFTSSMALHGYS